jgi:hypothetical protein
MDPYFFFIRSFINVSTALCWAVSFAIFFTQTVGLLGRVTSPSQGRHLHRTTQTQNKRTHRHPCLEWDSNPQSQRSSELRRFKPQTARPLWSAIFSCGKQNVYKCVIYEGFEVLVAVVMKSSIFRDITPCSR